MDYAEAVSQIIDRASRIIPASGRGDVVSIARSHFSQSDHCEAEYVEPIAAVITQLLEEWSWEQKQEIWRSLDTSGGEPFEPDEIYPGIDLTLQDELLACVIAELSITEP